MLYESERFPTKAEAEAEGKRCQEAFGYGYNYTYRVWQDTSGEWVLDSSRYTSCD